MCHRYSGIWKFCFCPSLWPMKVTQSCLTFCDPMDCIVHGILQVWMLEWVAVSFSRGSSKPRGWTQVSHIAGRFFTSWATREALSVTWDVPQRLTPERYPTWFHLPSSQHCMHWTSLAPLSPSDHIFPVSWAIWDVFCEVLLEHAALWECGGC